MLHNTNEKLKKIILAILLGVILVTSCSCTLLTKSLDNRTGFSKYLAQVENGIRNEDWHQAQTNLEDSKNVWKTLKPLLQVDIDHDYVKEMEDGFTKLDGYLDTKDKSNSLVSILLIQSTWENIDSF